MKDLTKDLIRIRLEEDFGVKLSNTQFKKMKKAELIAKYEAYALPESLDIETPATPVATETLKETPVFQNKPVYFKEAINRRDPSNDEEYCDRCGGYGIFHTGVLNNQGIPAQPDEGICYKCKGLGVQNKITNNKEDITMMTTVQMMEALNNNGYTFNRNLTDKEIKEEYTEMLSDISLEEDVASGMSITEALKKSLVISNILKDNNNIITCCGTGRRPKYLFGYQKENYLPIIEKMKKGVRWLYDEKGVRKFITGGAQGWDQLLFWAVNAVKRDPKYSDIVNSVYIPFRGQELKWSANGLFGKREYYLILKLADEVKHITNFDNTSSYKDIVDAMMSRNHAMVNDSDYVFGCYQDDSWILPETKGGTSECLKYSVNNDKDIIILYFNNMTTKYMTTQNTNYNVLKNIIKGVK